MQDDDRFLGYLAAKRDLDSRSLNAHVRERLVAELAARERAIEVLEIGAGIGSTVERFAAEERLRIASYTAIDQSRRAIAAARDRLGGRRLPFELELVNGELHDFVARSEGRTWDLLTAHAVLDLLDLTTAVPALACLLRPGGFAYLTLNFDGATIFEPTTDRELESRIEAAYHATMDERLVAGRPSGDSRTGRHLLTELRQNGFGILAAGSSDWVVVAGPDGFSPDETLFLRYIVATVEGALTGRADLDPDDLATWATRRRAQIDDGSLIYVAHQLDVLAQR